MAIQTGTSDDEVMDSINTTPLVDVMLVLLIVFLITIPAVVHSIPVHLPEDKAQPAQQLQQPVVLTISKQGTVYWGMQQISKTQLVGRLQQAASRNPGLQVHIQGDQYTSYQAIARVIAATRKAGITSLSFITQPAV